LAAEQVRSQDLETRLAEQTAALAALERQRLAVEAALDEAEAALDEAEAALATLTGQHAAVVEERDRLANALQAPTPEGSGTTRSKPAKGTRRSPKQ